jgi:hypothetical protein
MRVVSVADRRFPRELGLLAMPHSVDAIAVGDDTAYLYVNYDNSIPFVSDFYTIDRCQ